MIIEKLIFFIHIFVLLILYLLFMFGPLYILKWIAWIPLLVSFSWIIFNGCIINQFHRSITIVNNENVSFMSTFILKFLSLFNKNYGKYIYNKYINKTNRDIFAGFFMTILFLTILIYRLFYINKI